MKDYRKFVFVLIAVAAVNLIVTLCLMPGLPAEVPSHFNINFEVDAMGPPWMIVLLPSVTLLFTISIAIEQKLRGKDYANNKPLTLFAIIFVGFFITLGWSLYAMTASGAQLGDVVEFPLPLVMGLGFSMLFVVMGNYLPTVQPNRTFGIRLPVTFASEDVWRKTHRFGGKVFVAQGLFAGVMSLVSYFTGLDWLLFAALVGGLIPSIVIVWVYAHRISKK